MMEATKRQLHAKLSDDISIHTSREGSDPHHACRMMGSSKFQSTLPRGKRPKTMERAAMLAQFQSTLPVREATIQPSAVFTAESFQSTLPRRKRPHHACRTMGSSKFQSTLPRRKRLTTMLGNDKIHPISIHASTREATPRTACSWQSRRFQSTFPRGKRQQKII